MELFAYVSLLTERSEGNEPSFDRVKDDIDQLLKKSQDCAIQAGFGQEDYELARFAICAWIDEKILSSRWIHKDKWQKQQLQRRLYNTTNAGEEFFDRMNELGPHQRDVREVFYMCLCLGFVGRFCNPGDEYLLEQVRVSNLKVLSGSSISVPSIGSDLLFPRAYPTVVSTGQVKTGWGPSLTLIAAIVSPVGLFGVLYLIYYFILKNLGESILGNM